MSLNAISINDPWDNSGGTYHDKRYDQIDDRGEWSQGCIPASQLRAGSRILAHGRVLDNDLDGYMVIELVPVLVLRDGEPWRDLFGRDITRFWCRDEMSGREGWESYGPRGMARVEPLLPWFPLARAACEAAEYATQLAAWETDGGT